jgi:Mn2+/Fe2+ NRAMP family transporter
VGLFNASLFAASILPLSTAYTVCEGLGFESGVGRKFSEAPLFYWLYTFLIAVGGALVLMIPSDRLVNIVLWSQVLNGVVLPFVLIFMLLLINKKDLMGEYTNTRLFNVIAWATTLVVIALSVAWMYASVGGKAGG